MGSIILFIILSRMHEYSSNKCVQRQILTRDAFPIKETSPYSICQLKCSKNDIHLGKTIMVMVIDPNSSTLTEACWTRAAYFKLISVKIADKVVLLRILAIF